MWDESGWIEIDGGGRTDAVAVAANLKCATCPGYSTWPWVMFTHFSTLCHGFQKRVYGKRVLEKKKTLMLRKDGAHAPRSDPDPGRPEEWLSRTLLFQAGGLKRFC